MTRRLAVCFGVAQALVLGSVSLRAQGAPPTTPLPAPAVPTALGARADISKMVQSTVQVFCGKAWGSGVVIADAQTVVTNYHVLDGCEATGPGDVIGVRAYNGAEAKARVVRAFKDVDIGVLHIAGTLPVVVSSLRSDATLHQMQTVIAVGYPGIGELGVVGDELARTSVGTVARPSRQDARAPRWVIEHGAPIFPGNSGGPLFDECGTVVGLNTFVSIDRSGAGSIPFAIGARTVQERAAGVLSSPIDFAQAACAATIEQKSAVLTAQAQKTGNDALVKTVSNAMARFSRWEKDYEKKSAARDSAVGDLTNFLQSQINDMRPELARSAGIVSSQGKSIDALQSKWTTMEGAWHKETQRLWIGVALAGSVGVASLLLFGMLRGRVARAEAGMELVEGRVEHLERRLERGMPGMLQRATRVFLGAPPTRPLAAGPTVSAAGGAHAVLSVSDVRGTTEFTLPAGHAAFLGREPSSPERNASRVVLIPIAERAPEGAVSRTHLRIDFDGTQLWATDLGSANGSTLLPSGDKLRAQVQTRIPAGGTVALAQKDYAVGGLVVDGDRTRLITGTT